MSSLFCRGAAPPPKRRWYGAGPTPPEPAEFGDEELNTGGDGPRMGGNGS
jgi:hypothetical protein